MPFRSLQAWLMYRFDALSAFSTLLLTLLALYTGVSPGLTAFVLIAASQCKLLTVVMHKSFSELTFLLCSCYVSSLPLQELWAASDGLCLR